MLSRRGKYMFFLRLPCRVVILLNYSLYSDFLTLLADAFLQTAY